MRSTGLLLNAKHEDKRSLSAGFIVVRCNYFEIFKLTVRNTGNAWRAQTVILMRGIDSHVISYRRHTLHSKA
jgi:hypothetical protein